MESSSPGGLRRKCVHLGTVDRAALEKIRQELELPSDALAVRVAIRRLAERLGQPAVLSDGVKGKSYA